MIFTDPCARQPALSDACADTQSWFWFLAGALVVAYAAKGKR